MKKCIGFAIANRDINRAFNLRRRLGSEAGLDAPIEKPKGMHWKTYERQMRKVRAAEAATLPWTIALLQKWGSFA
jgi:hypothetical protein